MLAQAIYTTLLEVALALRHLHRHGLAHCDVKPSNILLRSSPRDPRGWTAKLSDFGCVRLLSQPPQQHQQGQYGAGAGALGGGSARCSRTCSSRSGGTWLGGGSGGLPSNGNMTSPSAAAAGATAAAAANATADEVPLSPPSAAHIGGYSGPLSGSVAAPAPGFRAQSQPVGSFTHAAPEVFVRGAWLDASVDVYALGIVMWELACLAPVYPGLSPPEVGRLVLSGVRPVFGPHVPAEYSALASACWAHDPARRPTSAALVQRLQQLLRAQQDTAAAVVAAAAATASAAAAAAAAATARPWPHPAQNQQQQQQWPLSMRRTTITSIPSITSGFGLGSGITAGLGGSASIAGSDMGQLTNLAPAPITAAALVTAATAHVSPPGVNSPAPARAPGAAAAAGVEPAGMPPGAAGATAVAAAFAAAEQAHRASQSQLLQRQPRSQSPSPPPPLPPLHQRPQQQQQLVAAPYQRPYQPPYPATAPNAQPNNANGDDTTSSLLPMPSLPPALADVISDVAGAGADGAYGGYGGGYGGYDCTESLMLGGIDVSPRGGSGGGSVAIVPEDEPLLMMLLGGGGGGSGGMHAGYAGAVAAAAAASAFGAVGVTAAESAGRRRLTSG